MLSRFNDCRDNSAIAVALISVIVAKHVASIGIILVTNLELGILLDRFASFKSVMIVLYISMGSQDLRPIYVEGDGKAVETGKVRYCGHG